MVGGLDDARAEALRLACTTYAGVCRWARLMCIERACARACAPRVRVAAHSRS